MYFRTAVPDLHRAARAPKKKKDYFCGPLYSHFYVTVYFRIAVPDVHRAARAPKKKKDVHRTARAPQKRRNIFLHKRDVIFLLYF